MPVLFSFVPFYFADGADFFFVDCGESVSLTAHWGWMPAGE
jgi:hypothetical protein